MIDVTEHHHEARGDNAARGSVAVYGLGEVGVTLAVALANDGHSVTGIDTDESYCAELRAGRSRAHEAGLSERLDRALQTRKLVIASEPTEAAVHIVAVGSPLSETGVPDLSALTSVGRMIAKVLSRGDLVLLRSTVPVGFTRKHFLPLLEGASGLGGGHDFHLACTPARTLDGGGLAELPRLPQVVGGLTKPCAARAVGFWSRISEIVVEVPSLEAAEMVKLANNAFRDLCFAFANELAVFCDVYNLDAFDLIEAANEEYPRNRIPSPSPGVGGPCLPKDVFLYGQPCTVSGAEPRLAIAGRSINARAAGYPLCVVRRWIDLQGAEIAGRRVTILGMAFKGQPETIELRGSTSVEVARALVSSRAEVRVWDAVVPPRDLEGLGFATVENVTEELAGSEIVLILNNHPSHSEFDLVQCWSARQPTPKLIFDGWHQLNRERIERIPSVTYATMGYMSGRESP